MLLVVIAAGLLLVIKARGRTSGVLGAGADRELGDALDDRLDDRLDDVPAARPDDGRAADAARADRASAIQPGLEPGAMAGRWLELLLAVSAEFCCVFWAAAALSEWHGTTPAVASASLSAFMVGMAVPHGAAGWINRGRHPLSVMAGACAVALLGFALFWAGPSLLVSVIGLFVTGTGLAMLLPLALTRLMAARPEDRDLTSSRGALASGLAIGGAPLVLARLADSLQLRLAYLIVPALLVLLVLRVVAVRIRPGA